MGNTTIFWFHVPATDCESKEKKRKSENLANWINSFRLIVSLLIVNNVKRLALTLITDHSIQ